MNAVTSPGLVSSSYLLCILRVTGLLFLLLTPWALSAAPSPSAIKQQLEILHPYQTQIQQRLESNQLLINHIFKLLDKQQLPETLILVPLLESAYDTNVVSHANAAGLWQLMPATAKRFGLKVDENEDERFNATASSQAAINYLAFLYQKFEGNLALTLAGYNAGEGRVSKAIKQAKSHEFINLQLPAETRKYVARFYALKALVNINKLRSNDNDPLFLYGKKTTKPLVNLMPLAPIISL